MPEKYQLNEEDLDKVIGGLFVFHKKSKYLTFTHQNGTVTDHNILNYDKAWELANLLQAQNMPEDKIFQQLVSKKYVDGNIR